MNYKMRAERDPDRLIFTGDDGSVRELLCPDPARRSTERVGQTLTVKMAEPGGLASTGAVEEIGKYRIGHGYVIAQWRGAGNADPTGTVGVAG